MGKSYAVELDNFANTYEWAHKQDAASLGRLKHFLARWHGEHVRIVGSGGSYSAAVAAALFREIAHQSPTTPLTPIEFVSSLNRLASHSLLLSAEGKNKDVLAAAQASAQADISCAAVTLTASNPLVDFAVSNKSLRTFSYPMDWGKDGYLATNSLIGTVLIIYRMFFGEKRFSESLAHLFSQPRLTKRRNELAIFPSVEEAKRRGILLIYSAQAKPFAVDFESKAAESGLVSVQITDLRQFAHGRHLQLAVRQQPPFVICVYSETDSALAREITSHLPDRNFHEIKIDGISDQDVCVAGLVDAMYLIEAFAKDADYDPGQPDVPEFGRRIHAIDIRKVSAAPQPAKQDILELAARRKMGGVKSNLVSPLVKEAAERYWGKITRTKFKAIVFDFDGTLCRTENRYEGMPASIVDLICPLVSQGLVFAIATGRGDSLRDSLLQSFPSEMHSSIVVGYYSGAYIRSLDQPFEKPVANPEFEELWNWLNCSPYADLLKPLDSLVRGGQFSLRIPDAQRSARLRSAIGAWLYEKRKSSWRVFSSGHSIDVLDGVTSKRKVVSEIARKYGLQEDTQILRLGDSGHEEGNDFELLDQGLSLSCDKVSANLAACWNFGPAGNKQADVTSWYLQSITSQQNLFEIDERTLLLKIFEQVPTA
ncbi:HAD hydrolase family protein [Stenotrophobium rhamnosiphilum]|uniref:SIS domain-containing protein n=1 Tax=Stenotrophobium rhamnosiphilum TaxID=2029166 RepID=A0A2T5MCM7_9GAMM|nr:HAD hydrolase family protein [Stenotrophobium rhamnosiphilum]PTU30323.1 hypothetical protein CJD38_15365 [Stenotrophobium rhamnosiphilum]